MDEEQKKIEYLNMIHEIIARMSTISTVVKGFTVTLAVAFCAAVFDNKINDNLLLSSAFLPYISLLWLDIYYFGLERKYRALYDKVRISEKDIDYDLKIDKNLINDKEAKADFISCFSSKFIWLFYLPILIMLTVFFIRNYYINRCDFYNMFF